MKLFPTWRRCALIVAANANESTLHRRRRREDERPVEVRFPLAVRQSGRPAHSNINTTAKYLSVRTLCNVPIFLIIFFYFKN